MRKSKELKAKMDKYVADSTKLKGEALLDAQYKFRVIYISLELFLAANTVVFIYNINLSNGNHVKEAWAKIPGAIDFWSHTPAIVIPLIFCLVALFTRKFFVQALKILVDKIEYKDIV